MFTYRLTRQLESAAATISRILGINKVVEFNLNTIKPNYFSVLKRTYVFAYIDSPSYIKLEKY